MKLTLDDARAMLAYISTAAITGVHAIQDDNSHLGGMTVRYYDTAITKRILIERCLIRVIINDALANGYAVSVYDGEEWACRNVLSCKQAMAHIGQCDEERLFINTRDGGASIGWAFLVYGNDGWDVVADHSANLDMEWVLANANALSDHFANLLTN